MPPFEGGPQGTLALALAEALLKLRTRRNNPHPGDFLHQFWWNNMEIKWYNCCLIRLGKMTNDPNFTIVELKHYSSINMINWHNTTYQLHALLPIAEDRELWKQLNPKLK